MASNVRMAYIKLEAITLSVNAFSHLRLFARDVASSIGATHKRM